MLVGLTVLVLAAGSLVAVLFLRGNDADTSAAGATAGITPKSSPTGSPEPSGAPAAKVQAADLKVHDLGTLKGSTTIWGPKGIKAGTDVKFLLTGPQRYSKIVDESPYKLALDTRKLKNGEYKLV